MRHLHHFKLLAVFIVAIGFGVALCLPTSKAQAVVGENSFGGRISYYYPACLNGGIYTLVLSARPPYLAPLPYIWTPGTIGIPPSHPGQEILGLFDIPYMCVISYYPFFALPGLRMELEQVSPI